MNQHGISQKHMVHGAHSLKTLSVFYGMLGVGTDAIRV